MGLLARAVVKLVNAARKLQALQVSVHAGEVRDDVEQFEPYGMTAHPFSGAEALVIPVGGSADHTVAIVVADRRYRVKGLAEGEVCIYDDQGQRVHLTRSGIVIKSGLIELGDGGLTPTDGLVHGSGIDPFTGATYFSLGNASSVVRGKA